MRQRQHVFHVQIAILRPQIIQCAIIHEQIKRAGDVAKICEVVHDKVDLHSGGLRHRASLLDCRGCKIHPSHIKAVLCQENAVARGAAAEVNGAAGFDASALYQRHKFLPRPNVPGRAEIAIKNLIEPLHNTLLSAHLGTIPRLRQ